MPRQRQIRWRQSWTGPEWLGRIRWTTSTIRHCTVQKHLVPWINIWKLAVSLKRSFFSSKTRGWTEKAFFISKTRGCIEKALFQLEHPRMDSRGLLTTRNLEDGLKRPFPTKKLVTFVLPNRNTNMCPWAFRRTLTGYSPWSTQWRTSRASVQWPIQRRRWQERW